MKKVIYALMALLTLSFASCTKNEPVQEEPKEVSIVGNWNLQYLIPNVVDAGEIQGQKMEIPGFYFYISADKSFILCQGDGRLLSGTWVFNGDILVININYTDGNNEVRNYKVAKLTETELVLKQDVFDSEYNTSYGTYDFYYIR